MSANEIREIDAGKATIAEQLDRKQQYLENKRKEIDASLFLMLPVRLNCESLDDQFIETVFGQAIRMEDDGVKFLEPQEYTWEGYNPYVQRLSCPVCHVQQKFDLEGYDVGSCSDECPMGPDLVIDIETEPDSLKCNYCGSHFGVKGWIREYPMGAYDSSELEEFTE